MLLFADGFDTYGTGSADLPKRGWMNGATGVIDTGLGKYGGGTLGCGGYSFEDAATRTVIALPADITVGNTCYIAFQMYFVSASTATCPFFSLGLRTSLYSSTGWIQCCLDRNGSTIRMWNGNPFGFTNADVGSNLGSSSISTVDGTWYWVEIAYTPGSTGSFIMKINGSTAMSITSQNVCKQTTKSLGVVVFGGSTGNSGATIRNYWDDVLIWNTVAGDRFNGSMPEQRIQTLRPTADSSVQLTPSAGSNYQCVDDSPGDNGDTDYVSSSTVGQKDLYTLGDLVSLPALVNAVQLVASVKKTDAGTRQAKLRLKGTAEVASAPFDLAGGYKQLVSRWATSPDTGTQITGTEVNGFTAGVEVFS